MFRTWNSLYKVLVIVLLLPSVEFIIIRIVDVDGVCVGDGRQIWLFPFTIVRGKVFVRKEGADIRVVSRKELELAQQVFCALEIRRRAAWGYDGRQIEPEEICTSKATSKATTYLRGRDRRGFRLEESKGLRLHSMTHLRP